MKKIYEANWNVDSLIEYISTEGATVEQDNDGQIILYTDLWEHADGSLHDEPSEQWPKE
jgi:hypothetical protein